MPIMLRELNVCGFGLNGSLRKTDRANTTYGIMRNQIEKNAF